MTFPALIAKLRKAREGRDIDVCHGLDLAAQIVAEHFEQQAAAPDAVADVEAKLDAAYHLLNHIHREVASLEDFDAASLMEEIEQTLNGTRIFDDNKALWEENERLKARLAAMQPSVGEDA